VITMGKSVAGKIALGAMILVLFAVGATSGLAIWRQTAAMEAAEERAADLLSSAVAISSASDIVKQDVANLQQTARRLQEGNPTLLWIAINDEAGRTLTQWPESAVTSGTTGLLLRPIRAYGQNFGEIRMVFDRAPVESARAEILETTLQLAAVLLIVALLGSLIWAHFFARPIVALAGAAERVSKGDLAVSVPVSGRDEIGQLTGRFNDMVQSLARSRAALERTLNELSALYDVSRIINSTARRDDILRLNLESLATGFGFTPAAILLEIGHDWRLAARTGRPEGEPDAVDLDRLGLRGAAGAESPVEVDGTRLPAKWGFPASTHAVALRSGSHVVGLLLAGHTGGEIGGEGGKILSVVASQIAPPILITLMAERAEERLTNPFGYVLGELDGALEKAREFGVGLSILSFRIEDEAWRDGAPSVASMLEEVERATRAALPDAELILRYGVSRVIAVVPGWSRAEARAALMKLSLPHMERLETRSVNAPEDGSTAAELLAVLEGIQRA
jgi:HAMP domain-containing protein